jgi:hypothetical protein
MSEMPRTKEELVPILFRYFMAASLMSQEFEGHLKHDPNNSGLNEEDPMGIFLASKAGLKMTLWYATLYVVIEGWKAAKLTDSEVDRLLASPNTKLLKRLRDGVFHVQQDGWLPTKISDFFAPRNNTVEWARALTAELSRFLLVEMRKITAQP